MDIHTHLSLRARQGVAIQSGSLGRMPGRCGSCPMVPLDCRVACAPRNDKGGARMGGVVRQGLGIPFPLCCHCEPVRVWQSSRDRLAGCPGDAVVAQWFSWIATSGLCPFLAMTRCGLTGVVMWRAAGLPRRGFAPSRNDTVEQTDSD